MMHSKSQSENKISKLLESTRLQIIVEKDIKPYYTSNINNLSEIDYMVLNDNICLCIQDKLIKPIKINNYFTSLSRDDINKFVYFSECIKNLEHYISQNIIIGLYLTKNKVDDVTKSYLDNENNKYNNKLSRIRYYNIYDKDEDKLLKKIQIFLHKIQFYQYDSDGDCIMGEI